MSRQDGATAHRPGRFASGAAADVAGRPASEVTWSTIAGAALAPAAEQPPPSRPLQSPRTSPRLRQRATQEEPGQPSPTQRSCPRPNNRRRHVRCNPPGRPLDSDNAPPRRSLVNHRRRSARARGRTTAAVTPAAIHQHVPANPPTFARQGSVAHPLISPSRSADCCAPLRKARSAPWPNRAKPLASHAGGEKGVLRTIPLFPGDGSRSPALRGSAPSLPGRGMSHLYRGRDFHSAFRFDPKAPHPPTPTPQLHRPAPRPSHLARKDSLQSRPRLQVPSPSPSSASQKRRQIPSYSCTRYRPTPSGSMQGADRQQQQQPQQQHQQQPHQQQPPPPAGAIAPGRSPRGHPAPSYSAAGPRRPGRRPSWTS